MWAIYKTDDRGTMWYTGYQNDWSSDDRRAAQWPDKRDAATYAMKLEAATVWIEQPSDRTQQVTRVEHYRPKSR